MKAKRRKQNVLAEFRLVAARGRRPRLQVRWLYRPFYAATDEDRLYLVERPKWENVPLVRK